MLRSTKYSSLDVKQQDLPLNEPQEFDLDTSKAGEIDFACGMNMFKGKVVIE